MEDRGWRMEDSESFFAVRIFTLGLSILNPQFFILVRLANCLKLVKSPDGKYE